MPGSTPWEPWSPRPMPGDWQISWSAISPATLAGPTALRALGARPRLNSASRLRQLEATGAIASWLAMDNPRKEADRATWGRAGPPRPRHWSRPDEVITPAESGAFGTRLRALGERLPRRGVTYLETRREALSARCRGERSARCQDVPKVSASRGERRLPDASGVIRPQGELLGRTNRCAGPPLRGAGRAASKGERG